MDKKPYKNKSDFDPGRFRITIIFLDQVVLPDDNGGAEPQLVPVHTCKAVELPVRDGNQLEINAGASSMNEDRWFVIRAFTGFIPAKDMNVQFNGKKYLIRAVVPVDQPLKYYRVLCIRQDG